VPVCLWGMGARAAHKRHDGARHGHMDVAHGGIHGMHAYVTRMQCAAM
jgi:hypothetical protein